jgi:predicted permease
MLKMATMKLPTEWRTPLLLTAAVVVPLGFFVAGVSLWRFIQRNQETPSRAFEITVHLASGAVGLVILAIVLGLYMAPAIIARLRTHRNSTAIFALNLIAGWTFIGWVGALVWSLTEQPPVQVTTRVSPPVTPRVTH